MKDQLPYQFAESSFETSPLRFSSLSEPSSSLHSPLSSYNSPSFKTNSGSTDKLRRKAPSFTYRVREHVRMGTKLVETVKGKLILGAKIIQGGGRKNIFKQIFGEREGEQLLKASQCYLSTTAGPIAGLLFISTYKIAFCSERPITFPSPTGQLVRTLYKVLIPIEKIKGVNERENVNNPSQKYIEIVTEDDFEFWFMGFLRYQKAFNNLQKAISMYN